MEPLEVLLAVTVGVVWFWVMLTLMEKMRQRKWMVILDWWGISIGSWILDRCPRRFRDWALRRLMWG